MSLVYLQPVSSPKNKTNPSIQIWSITMIVSFFVQVLTQEDTDDLFPGKKSQPSMTTTGVTVTSGQDPSSSCQGPRWMPMMKAIQLWIIPVSTSNFDVYEGTGKKG